MTLRQFYCPQIYTGGHPVLGNFSCHQLVIELTEISQFIIIKWLKTVELKQTQKTEPYGWAKLENSNYSNNIVIIVTLFKVEKCGKCLHNLLSQRLMLKMLETPPPKKKERKNKETYIYLI